MALIQFFRSWFLPRPNVPRLEKEVSEEYRVAIEVYASTRRNQRFLNDSNNEALLVAGIMVDRVRETDTVLIYSKALEPAFYGEILLASKCRFQIILDDASGVEVIKRLPPDVQDRIEYRVSSSGQKRHFIVANNSFRHDASDRRDELYVVCNFREPLLTQKLRVHFSSAWVNATPYAEAA